MSADVGDDCAPPMPAAAPIHKTITLRKFDISKIGKRAIVIIIGKRAVGKSTLVKDILYHQDIPYGTFIVSRRGAWGSAVTPGSNNQLYSSMIPKELIHDTYTPELLKNAISRQSTEIRSIKKQQIQKQQKQLHYTAQFDTANANAFLLMDETLHDTSVLHDPNLRLVFMNGRSLNLLIILTLQYYLNIPPSFRSNTDYVFLFHENIISNKQRLYEQYGGMFPTFEMFSQVLDQCTENHGCLVLDNTAHTNKIEDTVFWYHAETHSPFTLCSTYQQHNTTPILSNTSVTCAKPQHNPIATASPIPPIPINVTTS